MDEQLDEIEQKTDILAEKLLNQEMWIDFGFILVKILTILVLSSLIIRVGRVFIRNMRKVKSKAPLRFSERREVTLAKLLQNILTYGVYFIAFVTILSTLTIDITGLLAGAGILGLAVGFGAQNLVKDIISGFFIIFEDQFSVGDQVRISQFEGVVQEIGLRTTKILNWRGELYILPNGSITEVTNFSIHNSIAVVDVGISYEGDINKAEAVIQKLLDGMPDRYEDLVGKPQLLGVQQLGPSEIILRITAETLPLRHWYIERQLRKELKLEFEAHNIDIPYQRIVMYSKGNDLEMENSIMKNLQKKQGE